MNKLLLILILTFIFQSLSKADDIRDFQIEEMSIGDSALEYYSETQIKTNEQNWYKSKKYSTSEIINSNNAIQISYKTKDSEYILVSIDKMEMMDISKCLEKLPLVLDEVALSFSEKVKLKGPERIIHWADKSNKSWHESYEFRFPNDDSIVVECYNWSKNVTWLDHLRVRIVTKEFWNFLYEQ